MPRRRTGPPWWQREPSRERPSVTCGWALSLLPPRGKDYDPRMATQTEPSPDWFSRLRPSEWADLHRGDTVNLTRNGELMVMTLTSDPVYDPETGQTTVHFTS